MEEIKEQKKQKEQKEQKEQLSALNKMSKKSVAIYHKVALYLGISDSSLGILYALLEAEAPCSQYDLCSEWCIPKQTINSAVSALRKKGLVTLFPVPGTRNRKDVVLTEAGREFAARSVGKLREVELSALSELNPEERSLYIRLNEKYNRSLSKKMDSLLAELDGEKHK